MQFLWCRRVQGPLTNHRIKQPSAPSSPPSAASRHPDARIGRLSPLEVPAWDPAVDNRLRRITGKKRKKGKEKKKENMDRRDRDGPLLKTCQTCFHAKIRCERTQDSGVCDRCLRLGKECIFGPARRRNAPPRNRIDRLEARVDRILGSRTPSPGASHEPDAAASTVVAEPCDPVADGVLSRQRAEGILDVYRSKMTHLFPFVLIPASVTFDALRADRPCLCLAMLAAASFDDVVLQRTLGRSFNQLIADKLARGNFASLDTLQGLLIHLAW